MHASNFNAANRSTNLHLKLSVIQPIRKFLVSAVLKHSFVNFTTKYKSSRVSFVSAQIPKHIKYLSISIVDKNKTQIDIRTVGKMSRAQLSSIILPSTDKRDLYFR